MVHSISWSFTLWCRMCQSNRICPSSVGSVRSAVGILSFQAFWIFGRNQILPLTARVPVGDPRSLDLASKAFRHERDRVHLGGEDVLKQSDVGYGESQRVDFAQPLLVGESRDVDPQLVECAVDAEWRTKEVLRFISLSPLMSWEAGVWFWLCLFSR